MSGNRPGGIASISSFRLGFAICGLAVGLGLSSCSPVSGKNWGAGGGSVTLTDNGSKITYALGHLTRDDRVYFVIVANGSAGVSWSGGEGNYRGQLLAKDGSKVEWSCMSQDGHGGKAIVDGHDFDLAKGALFLVSTKERPIRVEQLAVDAGQLQACADAGKFPALGKVDPKVATFLQSCKESE